MFKTSALLTALSLAALALAGTAHAQKIESLKAEPAKAEVGQAVKATTTFVLSNNAINCVVRLHWGDGASDDIKINQEKDVPLVREHSYAKPGAYQLKVEGKGGMKCLGNDQMAAVEITPKAPAKAAAASAPKAAVAAVAAAVSPCPEGWTVVKGSVKKKTGAFTCTAKKGTAMPQGKLACPEGLGYFELPKKRQLGCKA